CCVTPPARSTGWSPASSDPPPSRSPSATTWTRGTRVRQSVCASSPSTTASGSARSSASARRCAPNTWTPPAPSSSTSSLAPPTGSHPCPSRGVRDERRSALHAVPSPLVSPPRFGVVVAPETLLYHLRPARDHQRLRRLLRRGLPLARPCRRAGSRGL